MDVSLYEFDCQRALQHGLQFARTYGDSQLEVEHVALAMVRMALIGGLTPKQMEDIAHSLQHHLHSAGKAGGKGDVAFGKRLDRALDRAEMRAKGSLVDVKLMWRCLTEQSTALQIAIQKANALGADAVFQRGITDIAGREARNGNEKLDKVLTQFTVDFTALAERGELDPVIGRDEEVRRVFEILGRKKKNNPLLLGDPGVGKSAVAEAVALRIAEGTVPESMKSKRLLGLDLGLLLSGTKFRGDFEGRIKDLLAALADRHGEVILFIDEIHMVVGAGNQEGGADAANLLKPALARGELHCLGATTFEEYRKHIEKDAALERRFQPLIVNEPDSATALAILRGLKPRYEIHHGVKIDDSALAAAVELSTRYLSNRRLPDKAIDLVDEAASRLRLEVESVPGILDQLRAQIERFEIEKKAVGDDPRFRTAILKIEAQLAAVKEEHNRVEAIWLKHKELLNQRSYLERQRDDLRGLFEKARTTGNYELAARIQYSDSPETERLLLESDSKLQSMQEQYSYLRQIVGVHEVSQVLSDWTGIPTTKFMSNDASHGLEDRIAQRVFGQKAAISSVCRAVQRARVGVNDPRRPIGVFLFLGPTGVGKTELAKALTAELFHDESRLVRFDMSEYSEPHNAARLVGAPPGYVGFDSGGELTEALKRQPYSVVLLDEMDKAAPRIHDILLQAFDDGRLTDGRGRVVDLRHSLFVMTANLPYEVSLGSNTEDELRRDLSRQWRPEFVNRIDQIVPFQSLHLLHYRQILSKLLADLNERLTGRSMRIALSEALSERLCAEAAQSEFGARTLRRAFEHWVLDHVTNRILHQPFAVEGAWVLDLDSEAGVQWFRQFAGNYYLPPASSS